MSEEVWEFFANDEEGHPYRIVDPISVAYLTSEFQKMTENYVNPDDQAIDDLVVMIEDWLGQFEDPEDE